MNHVLAPSRPPRHAKRLCSQVSSRRRRGSSQDSKAIRFNPAGYAALDPSIDPSIEEASQYLPPAGGFEALSEALLDALDATEPGSDLEQDNPAQPSRPQAGVGEKLLAMSLLEEEEAERVDEPGANFVAPQPRHENPQVQMRHQLETQARWANNQPFCR